MNRNHQRERSAAAGNTVNQGRAVRATALISGASSGAVTALSPGATDTGFVRSSGVSQTGIYRRLPRLSAGQAARSGYRATMRGRVTAIPGATNKVLAFLGELQPRRLAQAVFGALSRSAPTAGAQILQHEHAG